MDSILVGMMPRFGDPGRYVMDRDDPVEDRHDHENEQSECEPVQEWIAYLIYHFYHAPCAASRARRAPVVVAARAPSCAQMAGTAILRGAELQSPTLLRDIPSIR
jgi:hypothetical protein